MWGYVGPREFEPHHVICIAIFDSPDATRFTSETVRSEVRLSERRRAGLYADLIAHLRAGRRPDEFSVDRFSRHIAVRAKELVRRVRMNLADIEYFRRLGQIESARLRAAWSKIQSPLIPAVHDAYLEDLLRMKVGVELGDAKIVTDYLRWATGRSGVKFVTADMKLLLVLKAPFDLAGLSQAEQEAVRRELGEVPTTRLGWFLRAEGMTKPVAEDFLDSDQFRSRLAQ